MTLQLTKHHGLRLAILTDTASCRGVSGSVNFLCLLSISDVDELRQCRIASVSEIRCENTVQAAFCMDA